MPELAYAGHHLTPAMAQEMATLHSLLEMARDMLANPQRFSRDDRFMFVETLDILAEQRQSSTLLASHSASSGVIAQLAFLEDDIESRERMAPARAA